MRTRSLLLFVLLVTLPGCIVTYRGFPEVAPEDNAVASKVPTIHYEVSSYNKGQKVDEPSKGIMYALLLNPLVWPETIRYPYMMPPTRVFMEEALAANTVFVKDTSEFPQAGKGLYCYVDVNSYSSPFTASEFMQLVLSAITVWVIPNFIENRIVVEVEYKLHRDGKFVQSYQYNVYNKGASGILLLPFAWVNFFTYSLEDAFRATTYQFLLDAQRDGNL